MERLWGKPPRLLIGGFYKREFLRLDDSGGEEFFIRPSPPVTVFRMIEYIHPKPGAAAFFTSLQPLACPEDFTWAMVPGDSRVLEEE